VRGFTLDWVRFQCHHHHRQTSRIQEVVTMVLLPWRWAKVLLRKRANFCFIKYYTPNISWIDTKNMMGFGKSCLWLQRFCVILGYQDERMSLLKNICTLPETNENAFEHRASLIQGRSWFHGGVSMFGIPNCWFFWRYKRFQDELSREIFFVDHNATAMRFIN